MTPRVRWIPLSVAGSFGVYLLPLVGPHGFWLLGETLFREVTAAHGRHEPAWIAADVGLALALQTTAALVLAWSLRGAWKRFLVWPIAIPLLFLVLEYAYLAAIPSRFLIEPDTAAERQEWPEHCVIQDASPMPVRTPVSAPALNVHAWWIQRPDGSDALLRVPACAITEARLPQPTRAADGKVDFMQSIQFAIADGTAIVERVETATGRRSWWLLREPGGTLDRLPVPDRPESAPILSDSGDAVAWLDAIAGSGPPVLDRVRVEPIGSRDTPPLTIELEPWGPASYVLLEVDARARELTLWRDDRLLIVGFDGDLRTRSTRADGIRAQPTTYQRSRDGWLAWDAYMDADAYHLSWQTPVGSGRHRVTKGRAITSAALDPSGRFIAVSATTTLSIGRAPDVVYVLRASDGAEVFRRYLPRYARSSVVFFGGGLFGYSDGGRTYVLRLPD